MDKAAFWGISLPAHRTRAMATEEHRAPSGLDAAPVPRIAPEAGCDEVGMADRFVAKHAHSVLHCDELGKWLCWDGSRWARDRNRLVWVKAEQTVQLLDQEWRETLRGSDTHASLKRILDHMRKRAGLNNMMEIVKGRPSIAIVPDVLDRDPWLLNCRNSTVDLRTGFAREPSPKDLITKQAAVHYDPGAPCPLWLAFLRQIFANDPEILAYIQRVVGYCLTGITTEHAMFFCYGVGANGKSVMWTVLQDMLGDYAIQADSDLLIVPKGADKHSTEMADLIGARLAMVTEVKRGRTLDEARLKQLAGGDRVAARKMRQDNVQFQMQAKLVMAANHRPPVDAFDYGTWRRIFLINYGVVIPDDQQDTGLAVKLATERAGILNWAIDGLRDYLKLGGLKPPESVRQDVAEYRSDMDVFSRFIRECCSVGEERKMRPGQARKAYCVWARDEGFGSRSSRWFAQQMKDRGFEKTTTKGKQSYVGVGLLTDWYERADTWKDGE